MDLADWERAIEDVWDRADSLSDEELRGEVKALAEEYPSQDGGGLFELAGSWDSTGRADKAIPIYQNALDVGLPETKRRQAVIQLASSMRNVGRFDEALELLRGEPTDAADGLDDAVIAFRALVMSDVGQTREALADSLEALAPHLSMYQRSVDNYARLLRKTEPGERLE